MTIVEEVCSRVATVIHSSPGSCGHVTCQLVAFVYLCGKFSGTFGEQVMHFCSLRPLIGLKSHQVRECMRRN